MSVVKGHRRRILAALVIGVGFQAGCLGDFGQRATEEISVVAEATSPDGRFAARYFTLSGGGAGGYVIGFVNVQPVSEPFNDKTGVMFMMTGSRVTHLDWSQPRLRIEYAKGANILQPSPELMKELPIDFIESLDGTPGNANRRTHPGQPD